MAQLDLVRLPSGTMGWQAFVDGLVGINDGAERYFLELKSDVQPATTVGNAKIAKFILGAANRSPGLAAKRFDGYALLVLGVANGRVVGIPSFEAKDLAKAVNKFVGVGADGPRWDFHSVDLGGGLQVVIIVVDPPKVGDPLWTCLSDGVEGLVDGRTYIRADGETREAKGNEVRALMAERMKVTPVAQLEVQLIGTAYRATCDDKVLEEFVAKERARLLEALPKPKPPVAKKPPADARTKAIGLLGYEGILGKDFLTSRNPFEQEKPETRTTEQYQAEIDRWEQTARRQWRLVLDRVLGRAGEAMQVEVTNLSSVFLEELEIRVHIEGNIEAVKCVSGKLNIRGSFAATPRPWGPKKVSIVSNFHVPNVQPIPQNFTPRSQYGIVKFENGGSVNLTCVEKDLRPLGKALSDDDDLVLIARDKNATEFRGTWTVTARGHNAVYKGDLVVPVTIKTADFTEWMRRQLGLTIGENSQT